MTTWKCREHTDIVVSKHAQAYYHRSRYHKRDMGKPYEATYIITRGGEPAEEEVPEITVPTPAAAVEPSEAVYPSYEEWPKEAAPPATEEEKPKGEAAPKPAMEAAALHLTGLWLALGDFIDGHVKEEKFKVHMTEAKAKDLDDGLKQMGLVVQPSPTVVVPNWAPFVLTLVATFGVPAVVIAKEYLGKFTEGLRERRKADASVHPPRGGSPSTPSPVETPAAKSAEPLSEPTRQPQPFLPEEK